MDQNEKDYLWMAYGDALSSPDLSTQNGAVIIKDNRLIGIGRNEFPRDVVYLPERLERPLKYSYTEHAERNAILHAARHGEALEGSTMYVLWGACADCARAIIQSGITKMVTHDYYRSNTRDFWSDSIKVAFQMFEESGVEVVFSTVELGMNTPLRFNGVEISF